jgi:hypothetical protein
MWKRESMICRNIERKTNEDFFIMLAQTRRKISLDALTLSGLGVDRSLVEGIAWFKCCSVALDE